MNKLTKEEVQKRVLIECEHISLEDFEWCEKTSTFTSKLDNLMLNFSNLEGITFNTGGYCTFKTGDRCTFYTGYFCIFDTGNHCNFKTGSRCNFNTGNHCNFKTINMCTFNTKSNCTFSTGLECTFSTGGTCVFDVNWGGGCTFDTGDGCSIARRGKSEVILSNKDTGTITICPTFVPGYLIDGKYYRDSVLQDGEYIIADGTLSKIVEHKGNIYKVVNHGSDKVTYLITNGDAWSHGDSLVEAKESFIYKIGTRDTSVYDNHTLTTVLTKEEAIKLYRVITGACESGVRRYVKSLTTVPTEMTVGELIELTSNKYGNRALVKFFNR